MSRCRPAARYRRATHSSARDLDSRAARRGRARPDRYSARRARRRAGPSRCAELRRTEFAGARGGDPRCHARAVLTRRPQGTHGNRFRNASPRTSSTSVASAACRSCSPGCSGCSRRCRNRAGSGPRDRHCGRALRMGSVRRRSRNRQRAACPGGGDRRDRSRDGRGCSAERLASGAHRRAHESRVRPAGRVAAVAPIVAPG